MSKSKDGNPRYRVSPAVLDYINHMSRILSCPVANALETLFNYGIGDFEALCSVGLGETHTIYRNRFGHFESLKKDKPEHLLRLKRALSERLRALCSKLHKPYSVVLSDILLHGYDNYVTSLIAWRLARPEQLVECPDSMGYSGYTLAGMPQNEANVPETEGVMTMDMMNQFIASI